MNLINIDNEVFFKYLIDFINNLNIFHLTLVERDSFQFIAISLNMQLISACVILK